MRTAATVVVFLMMAGSIVWGQQQPLPKPVTPKVPIPGSTPPHESGHGNGAPLPPRDAPPATESDSPISSFLDDQTLAVVQINLADLDLGAIQQWVLGAVEELRKTNKEVVRAQEDVNQELGQAFGAVEKFRSAGAKQAYIVASLADLTEQRPPAVVIPLAPGTDPKALEAMMNSGPASAPADAERLTTPQAQVVRGAVVYAAAATIDRLRSLHPATRPDVTRAFASAGMGHIHLAFVPQEQARKLLEEAVPTLPQELGGGPIQAVSRGIQWGELTIELPPNPSVHLLIQSKDADSAKSLEQIMDKGISSLEGMKKGPRELLAWKRLLRELQPKVQGDTLVTELTGEPTQELAGAIAASMLLAHNSAKRIQTADRMHQLGAAILSYAHDHDGRLPSALGDEVNKYLKEKVTEVWTDPLRPNQTKPYVYLRPADRLNTIKAPDRSVMFYENHTTWDDGIWVFFADGHGEWVARESEFRKMLDETKHLNPGASGMPQ